MYTLSNSSLFTLDISCGLEHSSTSFVAGIDDSAGYTFESVFKEFSYSLNTNQKVNVKNLPYINITKTSKILLSAYDIQIYEKNYQLNVDIEKDLKLKILEDDFKQILYLLIDNAIKYNNSDKKIFFSLKKVNKNIVLIISNPSFEKLPNDLNKIFDRFYTGDKTRSKDKNSYGLGLFILLTILKKYNYKYFVKYYDNLFTFKIIFK